MSAGKDLLAAGRHIALLFLTLHLSATLNSAASPSVEVKNSESTTQPASLKDHGRELTPAAVATGSAGPIELTLRIFETDIHPGQKLWFQLVAKNIGKSDVRILDKAFKDMWADIDTNWMRGVGAYLEIWSEDNNVLFPKPFPMFLCHKMKTREVTPDEEPEIHRLMEEWEKSGLSLEEINLKLDEYGRKRAFEEELNRSITQTLKPGETLESTPWARPKFKDCEHTPGDPIGPYAELWNYDLKFPGNYKVRGVYASSLERLRGTPYERPAQEDDVRVETPWIRLNVVP